MLRMDQHPAHFLKMLACLFQFVCDDGKMRNKSPTLANSKGIHAEGLTYSIKPWFAPEMGAARA